MSFINGLWLRPEFSPHSGLANENDAMLHCRNGRSQRRGQRLIHSLSLISVSPGVECVRRRACQRGMTDAEIEASAVRQGERLPVTVSEAHAAAGAVEPTHQVPEVAPGSAGRSAGEQHQVKVPGPKAAIVRRAASSGRARSRPGSLPGKHPSGIHRISLRLGAALLRAYIAGSRFPLGLSACDHG